MESMLIFVVCFAVALINFMIGYDQGKIDGLIEAFESVEYAKRMVRQLEESLRTSRIEKDILLRKYSDLMRKIKAMEGVAE